MGWNGRYLLLGSMCIACSLGLPRQALSVLLRSLLGRPWSRPPDGRSGPAAAIKSQQPGGTGRAPANDGFQRDFPGMHDTPIRQWNNRPSANDPTLLERRAGKQQVELPVGSHDHGG
jgi:hypothetical protein